MSLWRGAGDVTSAALSRIPLAAWQRSFPKDVIALCYHVISNEDLAHHKLSAYKSQNGFSADVAFAKDYAVTYEELAASRLRGKRLPPNRFLFTFDDGYAECFDVIRPVLLQHGVSGAFFVVTEFLDDRRPFVETSLSLCVDAVERMDAGRAQEIAAKVEALPRTRAISRQLQNMRTVATRDPVKLRILQWIIQQKESARACDVLGVDAEAYARGRRIFLQREQVRQMVAEGFTIGAHGLDHRCLESVDDAEIERQIVESCAAVRDLTGQARVPFAFPYIGLAVNRSTLAGIRARHPFVELFFDSGLLRRDHAFIVNRVFADAPAPNAKSNLPSIVCNAWSRPSAWLPS